MFKRRVLEHGGLKENRTIRLLDYLRVPVNKNRGKGSQNIDLYFISSCLNWNMDKISIVENSERGM